MEVAERMTADEYLAIEEEHRGWQLIAGEVVVSDPLLSHQRVVGALLFALMTWIREGDERGEVSLPIDVKIDEENVFGPDLSWYAHGNVPEDPDLRPFPVPDLAVEVRSPSTWRYDVGIKKSRYEARGLPELWLVDGRSATALVFRRSSSSSAGFDVASELDREHTLASPLLPGFELPLDLVFAT